MLDEETLACAVLTFCLDGADAIMCVTVRGVGCARDTVRLLHDARGGDSPLACAARKSLDDGFARGVVKWGRRLTARMMDSFHRARDRWLSRLALLPSSDADVLEDWLTAGGAQWIIAAHGPWWPSQLADLSIRRDWAPPLCLWGVGDPGALTSCPNPVAVVGSRDVNEYGSSLARELGRRIAAAGHLVVSGGAMGADAAAHWGALSAMRSAADPQTAGRTVAVFAGGLNHAGPQCNQRLFEQIVANHGALVSELCPDTIPEGRRFLLRNRIIAALASSVVVTQARLRSGALNTANWAMELNREVYAAPGDAGMPYNAGCNRLIHDQQAILLLSADGVDEICHAAHRPLLSSVASDAVPVASVDAGDGVSDARPCDGHGRPSDSDDDLVACRRAVYAAIRRCRTKRLTADAEHVAECMEGTVSFPDVLAMLGRLELAGFISMDNGIVRIVQQAA